MDAWNIILWTSFLVGSKVAIPLCFSDFWILSSLSGYLPIHATCGYNHVTGVVIARLSKYKTRYRF